MMTWVLVAMFIDDGYCSQIRGLESKTIVAFGSREKTIISK